MLTDYQWLGLLVFLLLAYTPAIVSIPFMKGVRSRYMMYKRSFTIPPVVFAVVWTVLYALVGVAGFLFWNTFDADPNLYCAGMVFWTAQLILNALWFPLFFGYGYVEIATIIVCMLLAFAIVTMSIFFPVNVAAGALTTPYVAWLVVATVFSVDICTHNEFVADDSE